MTDHDHDWYSERSATFGDRVAAAREALGMSDAELARRLGLKLKTVQAWEADAVEPRANRLQMLAGVLNVSLRWLLTGEGRDLDVPTTEALPADMAGILAEVRQLQGELVRTAERLGRLEKQLRLAVQDPA